MTSEAVVGPDGEAQKDLVSQEIVEENMVGTDAEKESVVLLEAVDETVRVSETVVLFVVGTQKKWENLC